MSPSLPKREEYTGGKELLSRSSDFAAPLLFYFQIEQLTDPWVPLIKIIALSHSQISAADVPTQVTPIILEPIEYYSLCKLLMGQAQLLISPYA